MRPSVLFVLGAFACGDSVATSTPDGSTPGPDASTQDSALPGPDSGADGTAPSPGISAKYPGDQGIDKDPAVVWVENFEEGSVPNVTARYESKQGDFALASDVAPKSAGKSSGRFRASVQSNAADLYKKFPQSYDELFVRYYAKYQSGIHWHHSSVWLGGYAPPTNYPNPQAGLKPNGDDRIAVAFEPGDGTVTANPRMDFYNYWMTMHSWMDVPSGTTAYYGNALIHQKNVVENDGAWMCIELHVKLNPNVANAAGAELDLWKNDALIRHFDDQGPKGYWTKDKFCPDDSAMDGPECTAYAPPSSTPREVLDLRWRSTTALRLNYFWPQNYITEGPQGDVEYDDMIVATARIGCLQ